MAYLIGLAFVAIIASLGAALFFMMRGNPGEGEQDTGAPSSHRMAKALAFRVGFSVLLFLLVLLAYQMGWIQPTGLPLNR